MSGATTRERRPAAPESTRVVDADRRRARATNELLHALAPSLGLEVSALRVLADEEAGSRTRGRGARALASGTTIWVDPRRYDPGRADGRALLAHEAAHVAQREQARTRPDRRPPSLAEAEREAAAVAAAIREGRDPPLPLATLPAGAVAADTGAAVADAPAPPQQDAAPRDPLATYRGWSRQLDALVDSVRKVHARRIAQIEDKLDGLWISDGDVDAVLTTLEPIPYEHAAALVRGLPDPRRRDLADNISPSHRRQYRATVLAVTAGLLPSELHTQRDAFDEMSLAALTPEERFLAIVVLLGLAPSTRARLLADSTRRDEIVALLAGNAPDAVKLAAERLERRGAIDAQRAAEEGLDGDPAAQDRLNALQALLRDPTAKQAGDALDDLAALHGGAASPQFRYTVERLEQVGAVDRMLRALPEREWAPDGPRRTAFVAIVHQRPPDMNVQLALDLLGTGLFDTISDAEARLAYEVVRTLPPDSRDRFLRRDEGIWLQRLEANLPPDVLGRSDFADLSDVEGAAERTKHLTQGGGADILKQILGTLNRGVGAGAAATVLDALTKIEKPEVRQAVIRRLDTLGQLEPVIDALPDHILLSEDSRPALTAVLGDRDTYHLERHARRLLSTGLLDWAVTSREAFIAFLLLRAMPAAERERFGQLDFIVGELSAEMRASAGLNLISSKTAETERASVQKRLSDERLWMPEHGAELRALIGIAVALGDRKWVFEQSQRRRAWEVPELRPIVARFELYDPDAKRTTYVPKREETAGLIDDYGAFSTVRMLAGGLYLLARERFKGQLYVDPWAGQIVGRDLPLADVQDILGGDIYGVRFSEGEGREQANALTIIWDERKGTLHVEIPTLALDSIAWVGSTYTARTGAVSARDIVIDAEFATGDLSHPRNADLTVTDVSVADALYGGDSVAAAARVHLAGFAAHGDVGTEPPRATTSGLLPIPIIGPIVEAISLLFKAGGSSRIGMYELRGARIQLESFEVEGLALGGELQIASLAVGKIRLAWGGTRAQYLRALIAGLDRRVDAAGASPEADKLREDRKAAKDELAGLEESERELMTLLRRAQADPASLTDDDQRRILELQQPGAGGLVIDTGPITIRGVSGQITAREITVEHVSGQGELPKYTLGLLTDPAMLSRFVREGPAPGTGESLLGRWTGEIDFGTVTALDVALEAEVPTVADLEREHKKLLEDAVKVAKDPVMRKRVEDRIALVELAVSAREQLDELNAVEQPTKEQAELRRGLYTLLARHFGITVDRAELGGTRLIGTGEDSLGTLHAKTLDVSVLAGDAYAAERITGADVSAYLTATGGYGFGARELHVEKARADELGSTVDSVDATGIKGTATAIKDGWRVDGLEIGTLTVGRIDWGTASKRIVSDRPIVATGLKATVTTTSTGKGDDAVSVYGIESLDIAQITIPATKGKQPGLVYEDLGSGLRVALFAGSVKGLWARGLTIRMAQETTFEAATDKPALGIGQFDALRFTAAFGKSFQVGGVLTSPAVQGTESALGITLVGTDAYAFDLRNVTLTEGKLTTPDGSVEIVRLPMSGRVTYASAGEESDIGLQGFTVPDLVLGEIKWKFKGGEVRSAGRSTLRGITATAGIHRDAKGLASATVTDVRIASVDSQDLRFVKPPLEVRVTKPAAPGRPPLEARDIRIEGLEYVRGAGVTAGQVTTGPAAVGLEAQFASGLATGTLSARSINVRFFPGDKFSVGAKDVKGAGEVTMGTDKAALSVDDVDARVDVGPNTIRIRASGAKPSPVNLALPPIRVPALDFTVSGIRIELLSGGLIDIDSLKTDITIELREEGQEPRVKRVTLGLLDLGAVKANRLRITDPAVFQVELEDATRPTVVEGVHIEDLALDFEKKGEAPKLAGYRKVKIDKVAIDRVFLSVGIGEILRRSAAAARAAGTPPSAAGFNPAVLVPFADLLNSLDGRVNFDLVLPTFVIISATTPAIGPVPSRTFTRRQQVPLPDFPIRIRIVKGQVDLARVLAGAVVGIDDALVFSLRSGGVLALEADPAPIIAQTTGYTPTGLPRKELVHWTLPGPELAPVLPSVGVPLSTARVPLSVFRISQYGLPAGASATWLEFDTAHLEFNSIDALLNAYNAKPVPIALPAGLGTITLGPYELKRLAITGSLPGGTKLDLGLDSLAVESLGLSLGAYGKGTTGELKIEGLTSGKLTFIGLDPETFSGHVARVRLENLDMRGTPPK